MSENIAARAVADRAAIERWENEGGSARSAPEARHAVVASADGVKIAISDWVKIPVLASLAVIVVLVGGSIAASLVSSACQHRR
jgi:hypothetical protein